MSDLAVPFGDDDSSVGYSAVSELLFGNIVSAVLLLRR